MDKQIIEEMARDFGNAQYMCNEASPCCKECILNGDCIPYEYARVAYNAGYRKIPENAVVLTRGEYEALTSDLDKTDYGDFENGYSQGYKQGSKETAEKFAERLKADGQFGYSMGIKIYTIEEKGIDEIAKEIMEGKE